MITEHDLAEAIAECEGQRNPTAGTCLKLAAFYTIRDKMFPRNEPMFYSTQKEPSNMDRTAERTVDTEFKEIAYATDVDELIQVMDELMSTLKVLVPKLYDGVMRKLS